MCRKNPIENTKNPNHIVILLITVLQDKYRCWLVVHHMCKSHKLFYIDIELKYFLANAKDGWSLPDKSKLWQQDRVPVSLVALQDFQIQMCQDSQQSFLWMEKGVDFPGVGRNTNVCLVIFFNKFYTTFSLKKKKKK